MWKRRMENRVLKDLAWIEVGIWEEDEQDVDGLTKTKDV